LKLESKQSHPFDKDLTGLADMDLAKRLVGVGPKIGYMARATVFHHHKESWPQVRRRFEREAIALRSIISELQFLRLDARRYLVARMLENQSANQT
jgi:GT2 family glycosyltransferase